MARIEADRDDLMRDAVALIRRGAWKLPSEPAPVIAGIRQDGGFSVYFGDDPCWHFDARNGVRRAFAGGVLYRTQGETLARLTRVRTPSATTLHRVDLAAVELGTFLTAMLERLAGFTAALEDGTAELQQTSPAECPLAEELLPRLRDILREPRLAPALRTRKT